MKKNGFTLIELIAIIVVLAVILLIAVPRVMKAIEESKKNSFKITGEKLIDGAKIKAVRNTTIGSTATLYTITDGAFVGDSLSVAGELPDNGSILIEESGATAIAVHNGKYCASKTTLQKKVIISEVSEDDCTLLLYPVINYNGFVTTRGVNSPVITPGLTPVSWNGSSWVNTTVNDPNWYNYTTADKKWANAVTLDGSMWVWIPRFAYQLSTNFHTNNAAGGTMNIKFLKGNSNDALDATVIATTPTYSGSSQTNYVVHPAFTFGDKEITGFWVAKFEATMGKAPNNSGTGSCNSLDNVTTENIKIVPNISAWRCISVSNAFANSYSMQSKQSIYGWADKRVNTHLTKNSEWSAVAYLSQSNYGKGTANIWMNPQSGYVTGCGGTAAGQTETGTCIPYNTETRTSTTANISGVYDMSGGSSEFVAAHVNNLVVGGQTYIAGQALMQADAKYRDVYTLGATDTAANNYAANENKFGAALWETSDSGSSDNRGWYVDDTRMPNTSSPWFIRGSFNRSYNGCGLFSFDKAGGGAAPDFSFRPVVMVGIGL